MAWISVHEQVLGGKLRNLSKEIGCSQNEALGILIRLWLWGINNSDKDGYIIGAEREDLAEILTVGLDVKCNTLDVVEALIRTAWIDMTQVGLYIHDWSEWQEQWYKAKGIREKDAQRKRDERAWKRNAVNVERVREVSQLEEVPQPGSVPKEEPQYSKDFEAFWNAYPRKVGKGEAYKKYKTRINDGWSPSELLGAAIKYANSCTSKKTEKEYIKHGKTFLSDSTPFADYLDKKIDEPAAKGNDDDPYGDWK